jgi:hypothetical protein
LLSAALAFVAPSTRAADDDAGARLEPPARGPAVRERGARRPRGGSSAAGALLITLLVGAMALYVVKRLRR